MKLYFLVLASLFFQSQLLKAEDVALNLFFKDDVAFKQGDLQDFEDSLQKIYPSLKIRNIVIDVDRFESQSEKRFELVKEKVRSSVGVDDKIRILAIHTHGETRKKKGKFETVLNHAGVISEDSLSPDFKNIFEPIRQHTSEDLVIVLNACSTLCGTETSVQNRAKTIFEYFGSKHGQLFGTKAPGASRQVAKKLKLAAPLTIMLGVALTAYTGFDILDYFHQIHNGMLLPNPADKTAILAYVTTLVDVALIGIMMPNLFVNMGYIIKAEDLKLLPATLYLDNSRILGSNSCQESFPDN